MGESKFWQSGNLVATLWQDKKIVRLLSTCCEPEGNDTVTRRRKGQDSKELPCPPALKMYCEYMGGVDRSDRNGGSVFYYFLDTAIANSYILY